MSPYRRSLEVTASHSNSSCSECHGFELQGASTGGRKIDSTVYDLGKKRVQAGEDRDATSRVERVSVRAGGREFVAHRGIIRIRHLHVGVRALS